MDESKKITTIYVPDNVLNFIDDLVKLKHVESRSKVTRDAINNLLMKNTILNKQMRLIRDSVLKREELKIESELNAVKKSRRLINADNNS